MTRTTTKMNPIPVRLSAEVRAAVEAAAEADGRSLSNYIHRVLERHVEELQAGKGVTSKREKG